MRLGLATGYKKSKEKPTTSLLKPYTNFDKLKNGSIDEMATFLGAGQHCEICPYLDKNCDSIECTTAMKEWLESETVTCRKHSTDLDVEYDESVFDDDDNMFRAYKEAD